MKIEDHRLLRDDGQPYPFVQTPNHGGPLVADALVIHFTAGRDADSSVRWLADPKARASAHVVIGEDGEITQLVPFNAIAWHAGASRLGARESVNRFSIGIELSNPGDLRRTGDKWRTWFGVEVPADHVIVAKHKNGGEERGWKIYSEAQLHAAIELGAVLVATYGLTTVVGHEDVSPGRKIDPGPAFPMERYRGYVLGRSEDQGIQTL